MLDSRYVHLHEALGLGPMWLNAGAKILGLPDAAGSRSGTVQPEAPAGRAAAPVLGQPEKQAEASAARMATLRHAAVAPARPHDAPLAAAAAETDTVQSETDWRRQLQGRLQSADVMAVSMCASPADVAAGRLFSGEDGVLLEKMFRAISLPGERVLLTAWLAGGPDFSAEPDEAAVARSALRVAEQWRQSQARILLLLGRHFFARADVAQQVAQMAGADACFHIPHPQQILNNPQLKRGAWETLQQLQARLEGGRHTDTA